MSPVSLNHKNHYREEPWKVI